MGATAPITPSAKAPQNSARHPIIREFACITAFALLAGCSAPMPRIGCCDQALAHHIQAEADKLPMPGIYELRASGSGGHVTLGGRVDSPDTLKQIVRSIANTPGLTQLSFLGVEFEPPDVPDDVIVAHARNAADQAIGNDLASKLGYYCEDHRLFVYGTLPSLPLREKLEEAIRQVHGVGLYHVTCEVVLTDPPSDARVVAAVKRKFRRPLDLANITFRASQVEVTSVQNVVYLTGKANTLLGKLSAGAQAAQVEGVRYVVNRIEVPGVPSMDVPRTQPPLNEQPSPAEPAAAKVLYEPASDTGELSEALRIATPPQ